MLRVSNRVSNRVETNPSKHLTTNPFNLLIQRREASETRGIRDAKHQRREASRLYNPFTPQIRCTQYPFLYIIPIAIRLVTTLKRDYASNQTTHDTPVAKMATHCFYDAFPAASGQ